MNQQQQRRQLQQPHQSSQQNSQEEQAELIATIQHDHIKMKEWYNSAPEAKSTLHSKYGTSYPPFWKDVIAWNGWKESRKLFLKSMELRQMQEKRRRMREEAAAGVGVTAITASESNLNRQGTESNANANANANANEKEAPKRKRRSRWGNSNAATSSSEANTSTNSSSSPAQKRRSRWGDSGISSRGRDATAKPYSTNSTTVLDILPGLPTNLNVQQSQKLRELQSLLREANKKLENLEVEAARVDNLPIGHADRSPSPPPGEFLCRLQIADYSFIACACICTACFFLFSI